jgi:peroxiredoxin
MIRLRCVIIGLLLSAAAGPSVVASDDILPSVDTTKKDPKRDFETLSLPDCFGKPFDLKQLDSAPIIAVAFVGTECPLAKLYGTRLQELSARYADRGVRFIAVCSNVQDSLTEIVAYRNKAGITFPMLIDSQQQLADLVKATRTPEIVILDDSRSVAYQGRIDDQYGIGIVREMPQQEFAAMALDALLAGQSPTVATTEAVGCLIGRHRKVEPHGDITYSKHIAPIFNSRCRECHRPGEIAPFPLTSYADTVGWEATIAEVVQEERMPPWNANPEFGHFKNDARLSVDEKRLIQEWISNGCPEGDPADLPIPPQFITGWRMSQPDLIIPVRQEAFTVPATGVVDYQYLKVDPKFTEDKYAIAAEARPGNPAVVHHIIAFLMIPGQRDIDLGKMLIGYAPGTSPLVFPEGTAMKIPAGTQFVFEMHYTPNGTEQTDISSIGLKFIDASDVKHEVVGLEAVNSKFRIKPGDATYRVEASERFREDITLLSLTPHMHLRGKSFRYEATFPDGKTEVLLDVPKYDFNWQLRYEFSEPRLIPAGTFVKCLAQFDNSSENLNNPDPSREVGWGQQSWDEMMIGFFTGMKPAPPQSATP